MSGNSQMPVLSKRLGLMVDILDKVMEFTIEEVEAINRYCADYHEVYKRKGKKTIVTEITMELMED